MTKNGVPKPEGGEKPSETDNIIDFEEQLKEVEKEKNQFHALAQKAQADLVNYKNRSAEELKEAIQSTNSRILLKILGGIDDFERAMKMVPEDAVSPQWLEGLELIHKSLGSILESEGVTKIEMEGKMFDPFLSEAVHYLESSEIDEGKVVEVIRVGYKHHNKVLRAAQVVVAKKSEKESGSKEEK